MTEKSLMTSTLAGGGLFIFDTGDIYGKNIFCHLNMAVIGRPGDNYCLPS
jgi:hypothetical protein